MTWGKSNHERSRVANFSLDSPISPHPLHLYLEEGGHTRVYMLQMDSLAYERDVGRNLFYNLRYNSHSPAYVYFSFPPP